MSSKTANRFKYGVWGLVGIPIVFSWWLVYRYGVDVPFWDEWSIAGLLHTIDQGALTFGVLFKQHNEHRILVPLLIQLAAAFTMGWDTRAGMWATQGLLFATMCGCVVLWRRSIPERDHWWTVLSLVVVSVLLFSPAQYQNLLWGFQVCFYVPIFCLVSSAVVASSPAIALGPALAATAALSTLATFSIFPGLLTWPLAAAALMLMRGRPRRDTALGWSCWGATCACVLIAYFAQYVRPAGGASLQTVLSDPVTLLAGLAVALGGSVGVGAQPVPSSMFAGGLIGIVFLALLATVWLRRSNASLVARTTPWIVMGGFGFLTMCAIVIGRVAYGYLALLESRYTAYSAWVLISSVMIASTLRDHRQTVASARAWGATCLLGVAVWSFGFPHHLTAIQRTYNERLQGLALYTFAELAPRAIPMIPLTINWPAVRELQLAAEKTGWRKARPTGPIWVVRRAGARCEFGAVEFMTTSPSRTLAGGWAYLPASGRPADLILATIGSSRRISIVQPPLIGRDDIADKVRSDGALVVGWTLETESPPPGETVEFWGLDVKSLRAYPLCRPS
jgi:hypothetical protein